MKPFDSLESEVRSYCRAFPVVFDRASSSHLYDEEGRAYLDFFAGAGALNYGHNPRDLRDALIAYLSADRVTHSLDMFTTAKRSFLEAFHEIILAPRGMDHRMLFPGPTGTNAVEAALKLARKATGRRTVMSFTRGFHGMTLGSLALTGNEGKRGGAGVPLDDVVVAPFDGFLGPEVDTVDVIERLLLNPSSGVDKPAAFVLETVQAEGGVHAASAGWLRRLAELARAQDILLVVDDIQVGCGRTGHFFSTEEAGITPDMICLSKSLSGYGLPMSMVLVRPELDVFEPGEHNGTFRGHMPAFVTATAALERWRDDALTQHVLGLCGRIGERLGDLAERRDMPLRGRGLIWGLDCGDARTARAVSAAAFERGLILETAGPKGEVAKLLPPLTLEEAELEQGLDRIEAALEAVEIDRLQPAPIAARRPEVSA